MSKLFYLQNIPEQLKDRAFILDTNIFIETAKMPELQELLIKIKEAGCLLLSTSSVRSEFLRGVKDLTTRQNLEKLFVVLGVQFVQGVDKMSFSDMGARFQLLIHKTAPKASIADEELLFLATMSIGKRKISLATINYKDVPHEFYDCNDVITIQDDNGIRTIGIYTVDEQAFARQISAFA